MRRRVMMIGIGVVVVAAIVAIVVVVIVKKTKKPVHSQTVYPPGPSQPVYPPPGTVATIPPKQGYGCRYYDCMSNPRLNTGECDVVGKVLATMGPFTQQVRVSTYKELEQAIAAATPGTAVILNPGVYYAGANPPSNPDNPAVYRKNKGAQKAGKEKFKGDPIADRGLVFQKAGTADRWITIVGPPTAILDGSDSTKYKNSVLTMVRSQYIRVIGITVRWGAKPVDIQACNNVLLWRVRVEKSLQCAIRLRFNSSGIVIQDCVVNTTGLLTDNGANGEGVYIGTAEGNAEEKGMDADRVNNVKVLYCTFESTSSENVDAKKNTSDIEIAYNDMRSTGMKGGNASKSFVGVKGDRIHVHHNLLRGGLADGAGFGVEGSNNTLEHNVCDGLPANAKACVNVKAGAVNNTFKCVQMRGSGAAACSKGCQVLGC